MSYTLPLNEAETQLRSLVRRTRMTQSPVMLTTEGTAEPIAVVLTMNAYLQAQRHQQRFYHLQLAYLKQWIDRVEQQWDIDAVREECVIVWQDGIVSLWEVAPTRVQEFCAALILAVKALDFRSISKDQLAALNYSLELLRDSDPDEQSQEKAHQMLIDSGIPPLLSYDDDALLQSYLEEL